MIAKFCFGLSLFVVASSFATPLFPTLQKNLDIIKDGSFKIVNGTPTDIQHHPYQAAIFWGGSFIMSGAIIDKEWILTTALPPNIVDEFKVSVGNKKLSEMDKRFDLEKIVIHPDYHLGADNSLSLLKLKKPLKFSKKVKKITIAAEKPKNKTNAIVSGWGASSTPYCKPNDNLLQGELTILDRESCKPAYIASVVSKTSFCGYKDNIFTTTGDVGGPLVQGKKLVGITFINLRHSYYCNDLEYCPSIFTDVSQFEEWIDSVITSE